MSDPAGSVLTGTPAAQPAAGGQPTTPPAAGTPTQPAAPASANWYDQPDYQETATWAKTRGYKFDDPNLVAEALRGHYNAEKLIGLDRAGRTLTLPKDDAAPQEWDQVYQKLGRPPTAKEYTLPPELKDDPVASAFAEAAHKAGFNQKQFAGAIEFVSQQAEAIKAQEDQQLEMKSQQQVEALRSEWGQEFELRTEASRRAVRELGLSQDEALSIERTLGVDRAAKVFFEIGKRLMEPSAEGMTGGKSTFGMSPTEARGRISTLQKDAEFGKRLSSGDASARSEWDRLHQIAYS